MPDLYDLIRNIRKRPAMYLGQPTLSNLRTFLAGYTFARRQQGIPATAQEQTFAEFPLWLQKEFSTSDPKYWDQVVLAICPNDQEPFDLFFQLFEQFLNTAAPSHNLQSHCQELIKAGTTLQPSLLLKP